MMFGYNQYDDVFDIVKEKYMLLSLTELKGLCNNYKIQLPYQADKNYIIFTALADYIGNENSLKEFYYTLPKTHQDIFRHIVYFKGSDVPKEIKKKFHFEIKLPTKSKTQRYVWWLDLFLDNHQMDLDIKEVFLSFLGDAVISQKTETIKDVDDINGIEIKRVTITNKPITQKLIEQKTKNIIESIYIFYNLLKAKNITVTQQNSLTVKTQKLLLESLQFSYDELYPFVSLFFELGYIEGKKEKYPTKTFDNLIKHLDGDIIKHFLENFMRLEFQYEARVFPFPFSATRNKFIANFRKEIVTIIKMLDGNNWINIEYIVEQIPLNLTTLEKITNNYRYSYQVSNSSYNSMKYLKTVIRYFVKGFISVLYRFGLCDIAQTKEIGYFVEDLPMIQSSYNMREFGALEYFKLTDLGKYVFGFQEEYISKDSYKLLLSSYSLEISVENESNLSELFLVNIATKIGQNKYKTDIKTFTQKMSSHKEFVHIKEAFLDKTDIIPQNWINFFSLLERRIEALNQVTNSAILIKIPNDKEIIELIATNQKLKQKIIKADNLHIVVLKENLQVVKAIFKELGIII